MTNQPIDRDMGDIGTTYYDSEQRRATRLHQVLGYVAAMMAVNGVGRLAPRVSRVHDHKGILQVHWTNAPSEIEKHAFKVAWSSEVGDGSELVEHFLDEAQLD